MNKQEVLYYYKRHKSIRKTAKEFSTTPKTIQSILSEFGELSWMKIDISQIKDQVIKDYKSGKSSQDICNSCDLSLHYVLCIIKSAEILRKRTQKNPPKEPDFFETINSEEKAYWLGMLYADGYVHYEKRCIELCLKDRHHVELFAYTVQGKNNVKEKHSIINGKEKINYRTCIYSSQLVSNLVDKGCFSNKSLNLIFPTLKQVPDEYLKDFIRGYYDGDGVCREQGREKGFLGTKQFLEILKALLVRNALVEGKLSVLKHGNIYEMRLGEEDTKKLDNYMYENATVFLERKR